MERTAVTNVSVSHAFVTNRNSDISHSNGPTGDSERCFCSFDSDIIDERISFPVDGWKWVKCTDTDILRLVFGISFIDSMCFIHYEDAIDSMFDIQLDDRMTGCVIVCSHLIVVRAVVANVLPIP